jgi:hypothetical protein
MADTASPVAKATGSTPGKIRTFLLDHERLLIVILVIAFGVWGYGKYADIRANEANVALQQAKLATDSQAKVVAAQAAQVQQDKADLEALLTKLEAQNAQLAQANVTLANALANQKKTDATLPLPQLAQRWNALVPDANPVATPNGQVQVSAAGAVATVQALEEVPALKDELKNETQLKVNDDLLITQQTKSIFDLNNSITGLNAKAVTDKTVCEDEKKVIVAQARKSKLKWFKWGVVVGFVGRQIIKTETGW